VSEHRSKKNGYIRLAHPVVCGLLVALAALAASRTASAQDQQDESDEVTFTPVPVTQFIDCLRSNPYEEPKVRDTVIRAKQSDTLILDFYGVRPATCGSQARVLAP
jgi:hypothetical protein